MNISLSVIMSIIFLIMTLTYIILQFEMRYNDNAFNNKLSSFLDGLSLLEKIVFVLMKEVINSKDIIIICYSIMSVVVALELLMSNPYNNNTARRTYSIYHYSVLWNIIIVVIERLITPNYISSISMIISSPIIILGLMFVRYDNSFLFFFSNKETEMTSLLFILQFISVVETYETDREKEIILESYVYLTESYCSNKNCYLKKYLKATQTTPAKLYLLFHADELYQKALTLYPLSNLTKIFYFDFLMNKLNNKHKALVELSKIKANEISLNNAFFIYRILNEINPISYNANLDDDISIDIVYKINFYKFKVKIKQVALLYMSFWNILPSANKNNNDVVELKNIGTTIHNTIETINSLFETLRQTSLNDGIVLKYYIDYSRYILYDITQADRYQCQLMSLIRETYNNEQEQTHIQNIAALTQTDNYEYIILSNRSNSFGLMEKVSFGVCKHLEYTADELINHPLDIILPELLKEKHNQLLHDKYDEFINLNLPCHNDKPIYKSSLSFAVTKSKYIIPLTVFPFIMANEAEDYFFISKIGIDPIISSEKECYVISDLNYTITNFTRSAVRLLEMSSKDIHNTNISTYISKTQFPLESNQHSLFNPKHLLNQNDLNYLTNNHSIIKINQQSVGYLFKIEARETKRNKENSQINDDIFDQNYLPSNNSQFAFNINEFTYKLYPKNNISNTKISANSKELFKHLLFSTKGTHIIQSSSESFSVDYSNTSSSNNNSSSISNSLLSSIQNIKAIKEPLTSSSNSNIDNYYHVNTDNILMQCYDYNKKQFDSVSKGEKPIELIFQKVIDLNTYSNIPPNNSETKTIIKLLKTKKYQSDANTRTRFISQLKYALNKHDKQKEIKLLSFISFGMLILCIIEGVFCFIFYQNAVGNIDRSNLLVISSFDMFINSVVTVFLVRELTLITNDKYVALSSDKTTYRKEIINELLQYSANSTFIFDQIIKNSFYISAKNSIELYNSTMKIFVMLDDLSLLTFNICLYDTVSVSLDTLNHLPDTPQEEIIPSFKDAYFHIINGFNAVNHYMNIQATIFIEELNFQIQSINADSLIILFVLLFLNIMTYILMLAAYLRVEKKKENYINVFFEIDNDNIHKLLTLCEEFIYKYNNKSLLLNLDSNYNCDVDVNDNDTDDDTKEEVFRINQKQQIMNGPKSILNTIFKCTFESILIRLFYIGYLSIIIIILAILMAIAKYALMKISLAIQLIHTELFFYTKCLLVFNSLREYMFDKTINVFYEPLETYISESFEVLYVLLLEKNDINQKFIRYTPPEYLAVDSELKSRDICDFYTSVASLPVVFSCQNISYGANELGINIFTSFFIEEIRTIKHLYDISTIEAKKYGFEYNETLFGLVAYEKLYPNDPNETINELYEEYHPINFFNSYSHDLVVIAFRFILIPIINYLKNGMILGLVNDASNFTLAFTAFIIFYIILIIVAYFLVWKNIEKKLRDMIYSTKSMLNIIPAELLITLPSIESIFVLNG